MRAPRLFWQIFSAYLGIAVILMVLGGIYTSRQVRDEYLAAKAAELETGARACATRVRGVISAGDLAAVEPVCREMGDALDMRFTVILPSGRVVGESSEDAQVMENHADRPEIRAALAGGVGRSTRFSATLGRDLMYVAVPVVGAKGVAAVVRTALPIDALASALRAVYGRIAASGAIVVALAAGASLLLARRMARPLETLRFGAERFARGELEHRLPEAGAEEIRMLAGAMNRMAAQMHARIDTIVKQENEHQAVLSSMEEGVLAVERGGTILSLNETCGALLGVVAGDIRGRLVHEVIRQPGLLDFVERTLASGGPVEEDFEIHGTHTRWLHAHGALLRDARGHEIGALVVLHDITRLRHLENVRRDFVANVSHELRTPITSIKGFVETLLHEGFEDRESALRFLGIVLRQANRLDAIIHDLLMLSRLERGAEEQTIECDCEPLADVLRAAVEMCEKKAAEKRIVVEICCPADLTARINAPLLEQAVVNLVDNAIKYSDPGGAVRVSACPTDDAILIRVQDDGCGIAARHLPRLFERFYRVDRARSRELGGTGLGLAIVKHIVLAHKGSIHVESVVARGSTFTIELPAQ